MSKQLIELATEIADSREADLPLKLVKIKDLALYNDDPKKMKYDIYKFELLEALSVAFTYEYGFIKDGWKIALDLVKTFNICTTDFELTDKKYQNLFLPSATENILILAKKIQEKHVKSKSFSDEYLKLFREIMNEYVKINTNNSFIAHKSLKSQRLFQLLLNDEQYTHAIVLNTYNSLIKIKSTLLRHLDEKSLNMLLDEIVYKMATSDLADVGIAVFRLLNTMCQIDPNMIKFIVRRYKGIKMLINSWSTKIAGNELKKFFEIWEDADRTKFTDQEIHNKVVLIQRHWRGYAERQRLRRLNQTFARMQQKYRAQKRANEKRKQKRLAQDELKFKLMLEHRRRQRQRKVDLIELMEILPPNQIEPFMERQREFAARTIQACFRGYKERKQMANIKKNAIEYKAAVKIQLAFRQWRNRIKKRREQPAFYSRPPGLDGPRREFLFDKIRQHLDSLPPHPRTLKSAQQLHDKAQREFQKYVLGQRSLRQQQHNIQVLLTLANNDADLLINSPKLAQATEDDIETFYSHKSKPVVLAAQQAHKNMLRKQRAPWFKMLNDESDSDDELLDDDLDELAKDIRNLNFEQDTDHYFNADRIGRYSSFRESKVDNRHFNHLHHQTPQGITKKERNQLKTNYLRKTITRMMHQNPEKSRIWNDELFDDMNVQHTLSLLENQKNPKP